MTIANSKIEEHPFDAYVPENARVLILGSFPGKEQTQQKTGELDENEWFYGAKRNQFWRIIKEVFDIELGNKKVKQQLFKENRIAITDIFSKVIRQNDSNLDSNLLVKEDNKSCIQDILQDSKIEKILFTSKYVEKEFQKLFPEVSIGECLPSPSPRYARMKFGEKVEHYKSKLLLQ